MLNASTPDGLGSLLAALAGCRCDVIGPIVQGAATADAALLLSEHHIVLLRVSNEAGADEAAHGLAAFESGRPMFGPNHQAIRVESPRILRVVAVVEDVLPTVTTNVAAISVHRLASALRVSLDTDDVWLGLAACDSATDGWLGPGPLTPHQLPFPEWATSEVIELGRSAEEMLAAAGLPPSWEWQSTHTDDDGLTLLVTVDGPDCMFLAEDARHGVLVDLSGTPEESRPFLMALGRALLADLVHVATGGGSVLADQAWAEDPRVLQLCFFVSDEASEGKIRLETSFGTHGGWAGVLLRGDVITASSVDLRRVRKLVAGAVARSARDLAGARGFPRGARAEAAFVDAWDGAPLSLVTQAGVSSPATAGVDEPLASSATEILGDRFALTAAEGLEPGVFRGADASRLLNHHVIPGLVRLIAQLARDIEGTAAVQAALGRLQEVLATQMRRNEQLTWAMSGPWARAWLADSLSSANETQLTARSAEMVAEALLRGDLTRTGRQPDRIDARIWSACAARAVQYALHSQSAYFGLQKMAVDISPAAVSVAMSESAVQVQAYLSLRHLMAMALSPGEPEPLPEPQPGDASFAPASFQRLSESSEFGPVDPIDKVMRQALGTGLDGIVAVLASAADLHHSPRHPVVKIGIRDFDRDVADWAGLPDEEVRAARDLLTLEPGSFAQEPFEFWKLEDREIRLATRPLLRMGDELWVAPARARATQLLFVSYLNDGRLPWPKRVLTRAHMMPLRREISAFRQRANAQVEKSIAARVLEIGWPTRRNIRPHRKGLSWLPGEIDVLAADPRLRRLWVIEAKDPERPFSPPEIAHEISDMHGEHWPSKSGRNTRDEVGILLAKARAIENHLQESLNFLGVSALSVSDWSVHPLVVTPELSPAGLLLESRSLFAVLDQIPDVLQQPQLPTQGLVLLQPESWSPAAI